MDLSVSARVGANVRRFRTSRGMSQRRLGEMLHDVGLDLSISGLSRLENGDRPVTVDELALVADVLDQAPADLLEQETIVTGSGDLRMRLEQRHEPAGVAEPVEPTPVIDPKMLDVIASLAIGEELRALMQTLASTTVTRSQGERLRLLATAVSATLSPDLAANVAAAEQARQPRQRHTRRAHDRDVVARRA